MRNKSLAGMACPAARALDVVGEWWTLLIVRDAILGARRFEDFRSIGMADNILSARLKRLVAEEIFERVPYRQNPLRYEYVLTEKGRELGYVVASLRAWGRKWAPGRTDKTQLLHADCRHEPALVMFCETCQRAINPSEIRAKSGSAA